MQNDEFVLRGIYIHNTTTYTKERNDVILLKYSLLVRLFLLLSKTEIQFFIYRLEVGSILRPIPSIFPKAKRRHI